MKTFKQYITEAGIKPSGVKTGKGFVKGWTFKNKIVTVTSDFDNYHIKQVIKQPRKFGLTKKKIVDIFAKEYRDAPEDYPEGLYDMIWDGKVDNDVYLEEYLMKKGYCMFVLDQKHGRVSGWDDKSVKMGVKVIDDEYLPFEVRKDFKLFDIKPSKGKDQYITNKLDFNNYLSGREKAKYVSPMAQFREAKQQPTEYVLWGVPPGEREEVLVLDAPGGKPITKLSDAKKYKEILEKEHGVKKIRIQTIDFSQDLSKMFSGKNIVR
jgi:hypothetical protein